MTAALFSPARLQTGDVLIVVDVQNDVMPGGPAAVPEGNAVIPPLNRCAKLFELRRLPIFASRDWHPPDHCSFRDYGGSLPSHCVAGSHGAEFPAELMLPPSTCVISKGTTASRNAYSGFDGTDLESQLREAGARRLFVGGLATDYSVLETVMDALKCGFRVVLLSDAIRAVNAKPGDGERAKRKMQRRGAVARFSTELSA
jgi:nicotinamidase/pyrazinamidase